MCFYIYSLNIYSLVYFVLLKVLLRLINPVIV